ncbi:MAG: N-glycosylase/DNA lyase [Candidatus Aenigmatarchaeota archaeon]
MDKLLRKIENLKNGDVRGLVDARLRQFKELGGKSADEIFGELCFCIMTANFNAQRSIDIQGSVGRGFCNMAERELATKLREFGHRFPEARARYMVEARKHMPTLKATLSESGSESELRGWLAENVTGLGYKEASHFMRNIGFTDVAIVDFHIIDLLVRHGIITRPKTLTPKNYLEIEGVLRDIARKSDLNLAELDLYLWYMETGKILK